jgi:Cu/Ag efflux protein CusF
MNHWSRKHLAALVSVFILFASCSQKREIATAKHYRLQGVVVGLDPKVKTATIQHGPIPGWMDAMTMEYPVRSKSEFAKLHVGDRIAATVNVHGDEYDLTDINK